MDYDEYECQNCGEIWELIPEDYNWDETSYPDECPLCTMPVTQMIRDVFREEGLVAVIRQFYLRFI